MGPGTMLPSMVWPGDLGARGHRKAPLVSFRFWCPSFPPLSNVALHLIDYASYFPAPVFCFFSFPSFSQVKVWKLLSREMGRSSGEKQASNIVEGGSQGKASKGSIVKNRGGPIQTP